MGRRLGSSGVGPQSVFRRRDLGRKGSGKKGTETFMATVTETVLARYSVRAFLDRPVDRRLVEEIIDTAKRAPSGGNLQPWHVDVLAGEPLAELKARVRTALATNPRGERTEFPVYPPALPEPWRSRRCKDGWLLSEAPG